MTILKKSSELFHFLTGKIVNRGSIPRTNISRLKISIFLVNMGTYFLFF